MALTLRSAMQAEPLKNFRLAAGAAGLDRRLAAVNILDYEYDNIEREAPPRGLFQNGALVLSSMYFAKNKPRLVLPALAALVREGASALAVKQVCLKELPQDAAAYAEETGFPVFFFDGAYFEDVIMALSSLLSQHGDFEALERSAAALVENCLNRGDARALAAELRLPSGSAYFSCCLKDKDEAADFYPFFAARRNWTGQALLLPYKGRLFFTVNAEGDEAAAAARFCASEGLPRERYFAGLGRLHTGPEELDYSLIESLSACEAACRRQAPQLRFDETGLERLFAPLADNYWLRGFCGSLLEPLRSYDAEHGSQLLETLRAYAGCEGDAVSAAAGLHIHKNTVHYRINQIKELLGVESGFYEQAALAVRFEDFVRRPKS